MMCDCISVLTFEVVIFLFRKIIYHFKGGDCCVPEPLWSGGRDHNQFHNQSTHTTTYNIHTTNIPYIPQTYDTCHIYITPILYQRMWYICGMVVAYVVWLWYMWYGYGSGMNVVWL